MVAGRHDLFCGAGGAAMGYWRAGFDVVGVDIKPHKNFPFDFVQSDALNLPFALSPFDVIHASPPCQDYSRGAHISGNHNTQRAAPRLIEPIRELLQRSGRFYVIENVEGAFDFMNRPIRLCGTSFGLRVWRHRLFESNVQLLNGQCCWHRKGDVSVRKKRGEFIGIFREGSTMKGSKTNPLRPRPLFAPLEARKEAMGIDWMNAEELGESIPPAYTEFIGKQLIALISSQISDK